MPLAGGREVPVQWRSMQHGQRPYGTPPLWTEWQTDRREWKHYLPATSLAAVTRILPVLSHFYDVPNPRFQVDFVFLMYCFGWTNCKTRRYPWGIQGLVSTHSWSNFHFQVRGGWWWWVRYSRVVKTQSGGGGASASPGQISIFGEWWYSRVVKTQSAKSWPNFKRRGVF